MFGMQPTRRAAGKEAAKNTQGQMKKPPVETQLANALVVRGEQIRPNPKNARVLFDETDLKQLGATIKEHGLLAPLVVRYAPSRYDATPLSSLTAAPLAGF